MARWIRPETRDQVARRGECSCCYCGRTGLRVGATLAGGKPAPDAVHLDHIVPRATSKAMGLRPDNRPVNLVVSCPACNESRGDLAIESWCLVVAERRLGETAPRSAVVALAEAILVTVAEQAASPLPERRAA